MYKIVFLQEALREFKKIDRIWQKRIPEKLRVLSANPADLSSNIRKLKGHYKDYFRLRVGDYRIIFAIEEDELIILIIRIGHRREIYRYF